MTTTHTFPKLFAACTALCLAVLPLSAATYGNFTYTDDGTSITITDYPTTEIGSVVIPAAIIGKPVTSIGSDAFIYCDGLTSITIPSSVTSIGDRAFFQCSGLTSVTIPSSVTGIGDGTFFNCSGLTSVTIPSSVTSVGYEAFGSCTGLTSVTIPSSVTVIGHSTFEGCSGLTSVTIPSSITSIGYMMFSGCSGLTSVTIPSSVTSIVDYAFYGCRGLTTAKFIGNAPSLGLSVFANAAPGFTINYTKGKTGFTSPTWNGYPCVGVAAAPEIDVQQPLGTSLVDGTAKKSFGTVAVGQSGGTKNFTIVNTGTANLASLAIIVDGANAGDFIIAPLAKTTLAPGGETTFKVTLKPTASGTRIAAIHIASNDADENPFGIQVAGAGVAP